MKKQLQFSIITLLTLGFGTVSMAQMPGPDAQELWNYFTETSPYTSWEFWPDHQGLQEGNAPHAPQHKVFVNELGLKSTHAPAGNGTIIVKENIGMDNELKALTVMYKVKGYNPAAGDWYWVKYSPEGKVAKAGKPAGCIGCHAGAEDNDYVLVHDFE